MARKKRRRLKKSVKRGCLLLFCLPIVIYLLFALRDIRDFSGFWFHRAEPEKMLSDSLTDLRERIDHLFQTPQRLDTSTISLEVYDLASRTVVYSRHPHRLVPPASCMKLLTAVGAMQYLGIDHKFLTQVLIVGEQTGETLHGDIVFRLDDDPMTESLVPMVEAISRRGIRHVEGQIVLDLLREDTLKAHSSAATWDIPYNRLPILLKGRERIYSDLQYLLAAKGIKVTNATSSLHHKSKDGIEIYRHETPLTDVLAPMLIHSSNIKADGLYGHLHRLPNRLPVARLSEDWWVRAMLPNVGEGTDDFVINDGSGLSPDNRLTALFLVQLLEYAWSHEDMRRVLIDEALATPGHPTRRGSLLGRMTAPMFQRRIFVKTGTLTTIGLSSLAGYAQTSDGRWLVFAIVNENSPVAESRIFQDSLCRELVK